MRWSANFVSKHAKVKIIRFHGALFYVTQICRPMRKCIMMSHQLKHGRQITASKFLHIITMG